ncbi:src kinase-associated phosphoprotein 2-A-like [Antedon mediterranea]|uniref:src kinase-associated phosphoprotein 2-A-like n=1 Tax=Antedon mediterranea TaxID=105859 RepID=UPI003AF51199
MDSELMEDLKHLLKGIETFMNSTLKRVYLKKDAENQKNTLVKSIATFLQKLDDVSGCSGEDDLQIDMAGVIDELGEDEVEAIPAQELKNPTKVGMLEKKKQGFGLQKNVRYCVIKYNILYYYKNRKDKKQTGAIVLDGYIARPLVKEGLQDDKKKEYAFELIHPTKRHYKFVAEDQPALTAWVKAVQLATNKHVESSESESEDEDLVTDEEDDVFQQDSVDSSGSRKNSKHSSVDESEYCEIPNKNRRPSRKLSKDVVHTVKEEEIPPPPEHRPPPRPDELPPLEKRPSQSECFQAFASDLKLRLVKVNVPSVPKIEPRLQKASNRDISNEIQNISLKPPVKPQRNWPKEATAVNNGLSKKSSRKKKPVALPPPPPSS